MANTKKPILDSRMRKDPAIVRRLKDQLATEKNVAKLKKAVAAGDMHEVHRLLPERAFYPAHAVRTESKQYAAIHKEMVDTEDRPCLVCGVRKSVLTDPKKKNDPALNPYGAKQMETHHHLIEWALANAIDPKKFNERVRPHFASRPQHDPEDAVYQQDMNADQIKDWVDHSRDNLWVLCDVHHRAPYLGIHAITYPIWGPMDLLKDDFDAKVREAISKEKTAKKPKATAKGAGA
jgi:hypothetical protein